MTEDMGVKAAGRGGIFDNFCMDDSLLFFFLLLVVLFQNGDFFGGFGGCGDDSLLFFFLLLIIIFSDGFGGSCR